MPCSSIKFHNRLVPRAKKTFSVVAGVALASLSIHCAAATADSSAKGGTLDFSSCAKPVWPKEALDAKKTGTVRLALLIGRDGAVIQSKVVKSSGHVELDEAARAGISKCSFIPGTTDGGPAEGWLLLQYVWSQD